MNPRPARSGRPAGREPEQVRSALLYAARQHFSQRDFKAVSVRELAKTAGVNPAMVNYYFGDKQGLYDAMVRESIGPLLEAIEQAEQPDTQLSLDELLHRYISILARNPWLPNLVVREVFYGSSEFRDTFVRRFAARLAAAFKQRLERDRNCSLLRKDLDPALATLSLISMAAFPFIARPVVEKTLELEVNADFAQPLIEHTLRIFHFGTNRDTEPRP